MRKHIKRIDSNAVPSCWCTSSTLANIFLLNSPFFPLFPVPSPLVDTESLHQGTYLAFPFSDQRVTRHYVLKKRLLSAGPRFDLIAPGTILIPVISTKYFAHGQVLFGSQKKYRMLGSFSIQCFDVDPPLDTLILPRLLGISKGSLQSL